MGILVAAPAGASTIAAQQNLGTTASLLPATPGKTGYVVTVRRQPFATTATLISSQNPSHVGQAVTFTATVAPTGTTILPTGSVVFRDGTTQLGTALLEGAGQASFTTSSLTAGSHNITAVYQPGTASASFTTSTSAILVQRVLEDKKEDPGKEKEDWQEKEETPVVRHHEDHEDHDDHARHCQQYKNEEDFQRHNDGSRFSEKDWEDIRRVCRKWWHKEDEDFFTVINKAHRAHVEGDFEKGGGGHEYYDKKHHRWYPEHHEKPYYHHEKKKHYQKPQPVVKHFAVTG